jgi:hypothetical protein
MATNLNDSYTVDGTGNQITLKVTVGQGQTGSISVSVDGNPVIKAGADVNGNYTDECEFTIGTNQALNGSVLTIPISVTRIQDNIAKTSVSISLSGGPQPSNYADLTANAAAKGNVINYMATIDLSS